MNLVNFHTFPDNKRFIVESEIGFCGQGLYQSYWIMANGNGHNKYTFTVERDGEEQQIEVEEKHVLDWHIAAQHDEDHPETLPHASVKFEALGKVIGSNQYKILYSTGCDNFTMLKGGLKIKSITIENQFMDKPFLDVTNENQYCALILEPRQILVRNILDNQEKEDEGSEEDDIIQ